MKGSLSTRIGMYEIPRLTSFARNDRRCEIRDKLMKLSIIILSYNTKDLTVKCIESLIDQYKKELEKGEFEIIVVDNGSKDGTVEILKPASPRGEQVQNDKRDSGQAVRRPELTAEWARMTRKITFIQNKVNVGFAKGCNIGVRESKGKYILFLNSDTEVLDRGFLKMIDYFDTNKKIGILGGKLLNSDRSPQPSAGKFYTMTNFLLLIIGGERFGWLRSSPKKIKRVDWVSGACFMIGRELFDKLGGFDEHFFMYMEDMELCFRAKDCGFPTYFYPDIKLIHQSLGSSNREFAVKNINKGILYFYKKHKSYWQYLLVKTLLRAKGAIRT